MDGTYCSKSNNCQKTYCPRHLKGFNGLYISLAEFNCEDVLNEKSSTSTSEKTEHVGE